MKLLLTALLIMVILVALSGVVYLVYKTVDYMVNQHFSLGDAVKWTWDDFTDLEIFRQKEDPTFLGYDTRNRIQLHGCVTK